MGFFNSINGGGVLKVYFGEGTSGTILYSDFMAVQSTVGGISWNSCSVNLAVTNGQKYTFHFTPTSMPDPYGVCIASPASVYTGGVFTLIDPGGECTYDGYSLFRTYMAIE